MGPPALVSLLSNSVKGKRMLWNELFLQDLCEFYDRSVTIREALLHPTAEPETWANYTIDETVAC